jgi:hypothetical protein
MDINFSLIGALRNGQVNNYIELICEDEPATMVIMQESQNVVVSQFEFGCCCVCHENLAWDIPKPIIHDSYKAFGVLKNLKTECNQIVALKTCGVKKHLSHLACLITSAISR